MLKKQQQQKKKPTTTKKKKKKQGKQKHPVSFSVLRKSELQIFKIKGS